MAARLLPPGFRGLDVDDHIVAQLEAQLASPDDRLFAEHRPKPGDVHVQSLLGRRGTVPRPQDLGQLIASNCPVAVRHQVGEQLPALPAGQLRLPPAPVNLELQRTTQVDQNADLRRVQVFPRAGGPDGEERIQRAISLEHEQRSTDPDRVATDEPSAAM